MNGGIGVLARSVGRRVLRGRGAGRVVPFVVRWGTARAQALRSGRGLVRGTVIVWPQAGRVSTIGRDFARPRRGEVLVRVTASAISPGTERAFYLSLPNAAASFPSFPGYSLAGTIVEVGKGVSRLKPGDHVALAAPHGSVAVAKAAEVFPIPEGVAAEDAAFVQLGIIALHAFRNAQVRPGEPVAVLGQGLIGQLVAQMAAAFGADPVISVARSGRRLTASLRRAARIIVTERDGIGEMEALGVPVTFEATGSPDGIPLALRCTGTGGRIILAGSTRGVTERTDFGLLADKRVAIVGAHISSLADDARPACAQTFFDLIEQKRIDVSSLISHRVHPCEAEWFYRRMAGSADTTIGAVFCWDRLTPAQRMRRIAFVAPPDLSPLRHQAMTQQPLAARMRAARDGVVHS